METNTDKPWEDQQIWLRLLIMVVLGFFYWFCQFIVFAFALVQLGYRLITGKPNQPMHNVSQRFSLYVKQLVDFLLFNTEHRPFPFSDFPADGGETSANTAQPSAASTPAPASPSPAARSSTASANGSDKKATRKKKQSAKKRSRKNTTATTDTPSTSPSAAADQATDDEGRSG